MYVFIMHGVLAMQHNNPDASVISQQMIRVFWTCRPTARVWQLDSSTKIGYNTMEITVTNAQENTATNTATHTANTATLITKSGNRILHEQPSAVRYLENTCSLSVAGMLG